MTLPSTAYDLTAMPTKGSRGPKPQLEIERFLAKVEVIAFSCWLWTGKTVNTGYGQFAIVRDNRWYNVLSHRYAYETWVGEAGRLFVCHTCDTPLCVNYRHLFLGTHSQNMIDMVRKGRGHHIGWPGSRSEEFCKRYGGENSHCAKLKDADAAVIIRLHQRLGHIRGTKAWLAKMFDTSKSNIGNIVHGRRRFAV